MREDEIHFAVRKYLKKEGWLLIAGEYPNGSDDELHSLRIMDRYLAKDNSPQHRKHSLNKLVPDLIAYKNQIFLIIEMKPSYSKEDEEKLELILSQRFNEFLHYLEEFIERHFPDKIDINKCSFLPTLGFQNSKKFPSNSTFAYLLIKDLDRVELVVP